MKIYEVSFNHNPTDPDVMRVWVQPTGLTNEERENLTHAKVERLDADTIFQWVGALLNVPVDDANELVDALACRAVYAYLERTHFYSGSMVNAMIEAMDMRMPHVDEK